MKMIFSFAQSKTWKDSLKWNVSSLNLTITVLIPTIASFIAGQIVRAKHFSPLQSSPNLNENSFNKSMYPIAPHNPKKINYREMDEILEANKVREECLQSRPNRSDSICGFVKEQQTSIPSKSCAKGLFHNWKEERNGKYLKSSRIPHYSPHRMMLSREAIWDFTVKSDIYYEVFVHPAMITAENPPETVLIIGDGKGASLREVLKYESVEEVAIIRLDEETMDNGDCMILKMNDSDELVELSGPCIDDYRVEMVIGAADDGVEDLLDEVDDEDYDIIVLDKDILSPETSLELSSYEDFFELLLGKLSTDGLLLIQLGPSPGPSIMKRPHENDERQWEIMDALDETGFDEIKVYDDNHSANVSVSFLIACKNSCDKFNSMDIANAELSLHKRLRKSYLGQSALQYFDSSVFMGYKVPSKWWENIYCGEEKNYKRCSLLSGYQGRVHVPSSDLEVKKSSVSKFAGRGIFTNVDIPKYAFINQNNAGDKIFASYETAEVIDGLMQFFPSSTRELATLMNYVEGYGVQTQFGSYYVDTSIASFVNHGCNGIFNLGSIWYSEIKGGIVSPLMTSTNSNLKAKYDGSRNDIFEAFDPLYARHIKQDTEDTDFALRDIRAGEELFSNYMEFSNIYEQDEIQETINDLERQCDGEIGLISSIEQ